MKTLKYIAAGALLVWAGATFGHESGAHAAHAGHTAAAAVQQPWGIAAPAGIASRTITLRMTDDMRFTPAQVSVRQGEVVRLRVENHGQVLHELVLGTPQTLDEHGAAMLAHPGMPHDAPHMAHVAPGQVGELAWRFNRPGRFDFACLIAGHYQAGMRGSVTVAP